MTHLDSRTSQAITLADQVAEQMFARFGRRIPLDDLQSLARTAAVDAANRWDGRGTFARFVVQRTRWGVCGAIRVRRRLPAHPTPESLHTTAALATERAADAQAQAENDPGFLGTAEEAPVLGMAALTASRVARLGAFLGRAAADFAVSLDAAEVTALADEQVDVEAETDRMRLRRAVMALPPPGARRRGEAQLPGRDLRRDRRDRRPLHIHPVLSVFAGDGEPAPRDGVAARGRGVSAGQLLRGPTGNTR